MTEQIPLYQGEQIDRLGYHGLRIIQNPAKFKFTIDAFLLASFVNPRPEHRLIDLGTGSGVLPLLLAGQDRLSKIYGLEIQPQLAEMARRSVRMNNLMDKVDIIDGDLRCLPVDLELNGFNHVVSNPPFFPAGKGVISGNAALAQAKFEVSCTLTDVVKAASRLVKGNGKVSMVYPAQRLAELIVVLEQHHLMPKMLCLVHPKEGERANLALVQARPGAKPGLEVLPPILVYGPDAQFSPAMQQIFNG
ncbi:MAG TPA: tRNA1(Val) (adenine(37)-N6)-methyltransferase, partial [Bacillota bacterium]|nr:tRNA1(Val) (adenine(37)-N6)-methyltransferase [Bacillota bacterium]